MTGKYGLQLVLFIANTRPYGEIQVGEMDAATHKDK